MATTKLSTALAQLTRLGNLAAFVRTDYGSTFAIRRLITSGPLAGGYAFDGLAVRTARALERRGFTATRA